MSKVLSEKQIKKNAYKPKTKWSVTKTNFSSVTWSDFKGKNFLSISEYSSSELLFLLEKALEMKNMQKAGQSHPYLKDKVLGMIFEKNSTRTRLSFEIAMMQLGGHAIFMSSKDLQIGRGETVHDTSKVFSRYVDGVMIRANSHDMVKEFAEHSSIPVINGLTDLHHPAQIMADFLTILEHKGRLKGLKINYVGDGNNNVCHSFIEGAAKLGVHLTIACPIGYEPNKVLLQSMKHVAKSTGSVIEVVNDPKAGVSNADIVVTDVWTSMGQENETEIRLKAFSPYQVNDQLLEGAKDDYLFLHCLPAHRGEEVTASVIDGKHSVVFDEAENRLHAQKAILVALMGNL
jgi:ornithine carbamoyltransferase